MKPPEDFLIALEAQRALARPISESAEAMIRSIKDSLGDLDYLTEATKSIQIAQREMFGGTAFLEAQKSIQSNIRDLAAASIDTSVFASQMAEATRSLAPMSDLLKGQIVAMQPIFEQGEQIRRIVRDLSGQLSIPSFQKLTLSHIALDGFLNLQAEQRQIVESPRINEGDKLFATGQVLLAGEVALASLDVLVPPPTAIEIEKVVVSLEELFSKRLPAIGNGLLAKWQSAHHAITTGSPDQAAVVCYSLRELMKGVINGLVEKQQTIFDAWIKEGQPTIAAKVRFLTQSSSLQSSFAALDGEETKKVLDYLNAEGVHRASPEQEQREIIAIIHRVGGYIGYLITLSGY